MARRYGRLNKYDSQLRRCAKSGFRFYESEMRFINGMWMHTKYIDEDELTKGRVRWGRTSDSVTPSDPITYIRSKSGDYIYDKAGRPLRSA